jgi:hypothetical protein
LALVAVLALFGLVERASANGRTSAHDLEELEALRAELRNTE